MFYSKRSLFLSAAGAILLGICLHFVYFCFPSPFTALFAPIKESLWEHCKLVFWPELLCALWLTRGRPGGIRPWLLCILLQCALMLGLGYLYHIFLGGKALWVDMVIYLLVMILGFLLAPSFSGPFTGKKWLLPVLASAVFAFALFWFTLYPPQHVLFADLSGAPAWIILPC